MTNWPASAERNASFSDFSSLLACMESPTEAMGVAKWVAAELGKLDCVLGLILIIVGVCVCVFEMVSCM